MPVLHMQTDGVRSAGQYLDQVASNLDQQSLHYFGGRNGFWRLEPAEYGEATEEAVSLAPMPGDDLPGAIQSILGYY